jgi:hypothetical protein
MTTPFDEEYVELLKEKRYPEFEDEGFHKGDKNGYSKDWWDRIYTYMACMERNRLKILDLETQIDYLTARRPTPVKV